MPTIEETLQIVKQQEKDLVFNEFNSETALSIGLAIIEHAKKENLHVTVDITVCGHQLFHYAFQNTSIFNDSMIIRKNRIANRYSMSSYQNKLMLQSTNRTLEDVGLSLAEYSFGGGAFPINVKNIGFIGTITISGLKDFEDHDLVVWGIEDYLKKQK